MFPNEHVYRRARSRSVAEGRKCIQADGSKRLWLTNEPSEVVDVDLPGRCAYAQNDAYLELCNSGWEQQWKAGIGTVFVLLPCLMIFWGFYGFAVLPLFTGEMIFLWFGAFDARSVFVWFGWLLLFPLSLGCGVLLWLWFDIMGVGTCFFTYARGRIRFNRLTRKVYVLRPKSCGGNGVLEWDRLCAILDMDGYDLLARKNAAPGKAAYYSLILYSPPADPTDPQAQGEDAVFVGPTLQMQQKASSVWEYIRCYMEYGPGREGVHKYLPQEYSTFCGKPSRSQYKLEQRPGVMETAYHMLSQVTCSWPRFPKEWQSDSGIGEPEEKPVQTGAVMTAMAYRAEGKLSKADEIELLTHWGTEDALREAKAGAGR
ncbi:DUF6708 domain-containing protein [Variovorax robiniae]|uniref:DUF6708 domain-containing protein n=1 Tax=Variovorax robiniae TaxID=1836199 RepID=A0ABU8XHB6_9BURK